MRRQCPCKINDGGQAWRDASLRGPNTGRQEGKINIKNREDGRMRGGGGARRGGGGGGGGGGNGYKAVASNHPHMHQTCLDMR